MEILHLSSYGCISFLVNTASFSEIENPQLRNSRCPLQAGGGTALWEACPALSTAHPQLSGLFNDYVSTSPSFKATYFKNHIRHSHRRKRIGKGTAYLTFEGWKSESFLKLDMNLSHEQLFPASRKTAAIQIWHLCSESHSVMSDSLQPLVDIFVGFCPFSLTFYMPCHFPVGLLRKTHSLISYFDI